MGIDIPASLELLNTANPWILPGYIPQSDDDPVELLCERSHFHYAYHAPALVNLCLLDAAAASQVFRFPAHASADGLTYTGEICIRPIATGTVDIDIEEATTGGGAYTSVSGFPKTTASLANTTAHWLSYDVPLATTTRFVRVTVDNGAGNVLCQAFLLYPKALGAITSGEKSSGFIGFDNAWMSAVANDSPIHTEIFNRCAWNFHYTQKDRRQCVWSYCQSTSGTDYRLAMTSQQNTRRVAYAPYSIGSSQPETVTVYAWAQDVGGAPQANIIVGQEGSKYAPASILADNTHRSTTMTLDPSAPQIIYANVDDPNGGVEVYYIKVEWQPSLLPVDGLGDPLPVINSVAPPPLRGYLNVLNIVGLQAVLNPYAITGLNFNPELGPASYWNWATRHGPGVYALHPGVTFSRTLNDAGNPVNAEIWSSSSQTGGPTGPPPPLNANEQIEIEDPIAGTWTYPPHEAATVAWGTDQWIASPGASDDGRRLFELTVADIPGTEYFKGKKCIGFGGVARYVDDLSSL